MDRLIATNTVPVGSGDVAPATGTPGQATDGNPATNVPATRFPAYAFNALQEELIGVITAAGLTPDRNNNAQVLASLRALSIAQVVAVVGAMQNAKMIVASASASATFTADEIVVKTGLGGTPYLLGSFSQTVSTSSTGIGGVVGTALSANGYAAIYAAYNPTTKQQGAFIVNANSLVPNVAASPPAGWVATALVSVWPLNASMQFVPGRQQGRRVGIATAGGFAVSATQTSYASVAVSGVPANAVRVQGNLSSLSTQANATIIFSVAPDSAGTSAKSNVSTTVVANNGTSMPVELDIFTPQTLYYRMPGSTGTPSMSLVVTSYDL